ncbi:TPA: hypothetical protein ACQ31S_001071 [Yersinia enterocolitica]
MVTVSWSQRDCAIESNDDVLSGVIKVTSPFVTGIMIPVTW